MKFKSVLFALFIVFFIFALVNTASAVENETDVVSDTLNDVSTPDIDISQSYEPEIVYEGDVIDVYVDITNNGNETVNNLTIFYDVPEEFELLLYPAEFMDGKFIVDSLYPGEMVRFTFICKALESNVTATFAASLDGITKIPLDVYVQPDRGNNESNQSDSGNSDYNNVNIELEPAGNPFVLLVLGLFALPLFVNRKH